jgi:glyoxylase-like metal-dependent hydrolase (beta-lactamase superfamily II)
MNPLEHEIHYPLGDALPPEGHCLDVAPGVKWIRMGLPFALDHINLWLLRDVQPVDGQPQQGWTVVDCCIASDTTQAQWAQLFQNALEGLPILRVIVTHMHPDHIGLAHWLCTHWQAPLWISATDYNAARMACRDLQGFGGESGVGFYHQHGLQDPAFLAHVRGRGSYYSSLVPDVPGSYRRLMDGDTLRIGAHTWECIVGYGHAPEHIALYCASLGVLISGDMVLPRISTNVSVHASEPEGDPLRLFLQSLQRYHSLPAQTLTLPSHGKPFHGLHQRVAQLEQHHADRLEEVRAACRQSPCSAAEIMSKMFRRPLGLHEQTFALGEALAHLHWLWHCGEVQRTQDAAGIYRFSAS